MKEAAFLAGLFFDFYIPRESQYLLKYFRSPLEVQFVKYYLCFGEIDNFVDHTGYFCQKRWLRILKKRFEKITAAHAQFKQNCDLERLEELESGKYKF